MRGATAAAATAAPADRAEGGAQQARGAVSRADLVGEAVSKMMGLSVDNLKEIVCMINKISQVARPRRRRGRRGGARRNRGNVEPALEIAGVVHRYSRDELYALRPVHDGQSGSFDRIPDCLRTGVEANVESLPQAELDSSELRHEQPV
eukprot:gene6054-5564_t